jgi:hypothetical protein
MLFEKISLEADEEVLMMVRKHWFVIVAELVAVGFVAALPFFALAGYALLGSPLTAMGVTTGIDGSLVTYLLAVWLFLCALSGFTIWTHYYLDLWVITDRRIISVDQIHFFNRNVASFRLERLQDIEFKVNGILATFLRYGTISAQTAGNHEHNFKATGMPNPRAVQACIQGAMDTRLQTLSMRPDLAE